MPHPTASDRALTAPVRTYSPLAAFLSYLVPGLGQIYQGRIGKGVLYLVCLYSLFFYGMYLGSWCNVYIPDIARTQEPWDNNPWHLSRPLANLYNRLQYAGQFWIGVAAWPAVWQYMNYDATRDTGPLFGNFERTPPESALQNDLQRDGDKTWDLGWIYTVIAGVLNILVIYDAYAGPAFTARNLQTEPAEEAATA